jgi:hypothetical protein
MAGRIPSQVPRLVRGSVVTDRRRCGKPTCRCAEAGAAGHESVVLSYSQAGRTHFLMLPRSRWRLCGLPPSATASRRPSWRR